MKEFKIYELYNELGNIVYVGCTSRKLNKRLNEHTKLNPKSKFYGQNLTMNVVKTYPEDKVDVAYYYEAYLKYMWGLNDEIKAEKSTYSARLKGGQSGGKIIGKKAVESGQIYKLSEDRQQPILVYKRNTGEFVGEYESHNEAARQLECSQCHVTNCVNGKRQHKEYIFKKKTS